MLENEQLKNILRRILLQDNVSKEILLNVVFNTVDTTLTGYERGSLEFYEALIEEAMEQTKNESEEE